MARRNLLALVGAGTLCLAACVGASPVASDGDDQPGEHSPDASGQTSSGGSSGEVRGSSSSSSGQSTSSSSSGAGGSSSGGALTDAGGDEDSSSNPADATPPAPDCTNPGLGAGAFVNTCRAKRSTTEVLPGSVLVQGDYVLTGWWACNGNNKFMGSATLYPSNGQFYMRYVHNRYLSDSTLLETVEGTSSLHTDPASGQLVRTEECRLGHVGDTETGFYNYDVATKRLVFKFSDHDEEWTQQ